MLRTVAERVRPVATQPGKSGAEAAQLCGVRSNRIVQVLFIFAPNRLAGKSISKFPVTSHRWAVRQW